jgi:hypothetical protein
MNANGDGLNNKETKRNEKGNGTEGNEQKNLAEGKWD